MSNMIAIPVVDYKMDKARAIILGIILIIILLFILNPGGFISSIVSKVINGIGDAISGVGSGISKGLYQASGQAAIDAANNSQTSRIDNYWKGNTWVNWMTSSLYESDPSNASIDEATATNLYNNVNSATGSSLFGIYISSGDFSGIQSDFENVIGNKTDISYVSYIAEQKAGKTLGQICQDPNNFYNSSMGASGKTNVQMLADFLDWANSLPEN